MTGRDRGFALLIVLWTIVLLAMIGTQVTAAGRGEVQLASNLRDAATAEAAADGAVFEAVFHALDTSERHWRADGTVRVLHPAGATVEVRIENEAGKINLNTASPALLAALMHAVGADTRSAAKLAAAIYDWRFPDAQQRGGAKTDEYRTAGRSYGPPSAPFQTLGELGLVLGMTPDLLARLRPHLTLFHDGEPSPAVAGPLVRQALLEATGALFNEPGPPEETVVVVTARAIGPGGAEFVRRAIVRLGLRTSGAVYQVLTWDTAPA